MLLNPEAIAGTEPAANDEVAITSSTELIGPDGLRTSCFDIASFDNLNFWAKTSGGGALYDGLGNKKQSFKPKEDGFHVPFLKWTPEIVEYLKKAVDSCVADRHSFGNLFKRMSGEERFGQTMSPSRVKKLFDDIYAIALVTKQNEEQQAENKKQRELANKNDEIALQEHIQKYSGGRLAPVA